MSVTAKHPRVNPALKLGLEFAPLVLFFLVNAYGQTLIDTYPALAGFRQPIFLATAVFMVAITISLALSWILTRHLAIMPLVSGVVVLVFGGLTLILENEVFIKVKPTIVNVLFGAILLGGLAFGKSLLAYVLDSAVKLSEQGWKTLTLRWGLFFFVLAVINEVVWRTQSTDFWVAFKVWGMMPITMVFALSQLPLMSRHMIEDDES